MKHDHLLSTYLACPDCGGHLSVTPTSLNCQSCGRRCHRRGNVIDLLPSQPKKLTGAFSAGAVSYYQRMFTLAPTQTWNDPTAWNAECQDKPSYRTFLDDEYALFESHFPKKRRVAADLSGGAGLYSRRLTAQFELVFHCDINLEYLQYTQQRAQAEGITNCYFIRADYHQPPFQKQSIDCFLCTDSLTYYGPRYDAQVIAQMRSQLAPAGVALFDVHHRKWYHQDPDIYEYNSQQLAFLTKLFPELVFQPFGRLPEVVILHPTLFKLWPLFPFLPAIRYVGVLRGATSI